MCDYSLQGIRNRLAEQGEILVVHRFQTGSKGLTSPRYLQPVDKPKTWMATLSAFLTELNCSSQEYQRVSSGGTVLPRTRL